MYSKSENLVRASRKGVLEDSNGIFWPMGSVGPKCGVGVRCCARNYQTKWVARQSDIRQDSLGTQATSSSSKWPELLHFWYNFYTPCFIYKNDNIHESEHATLHTTITSIH
jgi:hypothetical protein